MISTRVFGRLDDVDIIEATLVSKGASVSILNYGCIIRDWRVQTADGETPVVLGLDNFDDYLDQLPSGGTICGRVGNRIGRGKFTLNGQGYQLPLNDGRNHLHGGHGLGLRVWDMITDDATNSVTLTYHSPDGDEGYPANIDFTITLRLKGTKLTFEMHGMPDAPTPINLAQHNYYNLDGDGSVRDHVSQYAASSHTVVDDELIPTGEIASVTGTRFDFTTPASFAQTDPDRIGVDMNLVLDADRDTSQPAAVVTSPRSGLKLQLWTDEPGLQIFNAPLMDIPKMGIDGRSYGNFGGFCLEPQHYPDSVNQPDWPSTISTPDNPYYQKLVIDIAPT